MRKLLLTLLLLALSVPASAEDRLAWGGSMMVVGGGTEAAGESYVLKESATTNDTDYLGLANASVYEAGCGFDAASSHNIGKVTVTLKKTGTPANGTLTIKIYSVSATLPNTLLATSDGGGTTVAALTTSYADYDFTFSTPLDITSGTTYFISITTDALNDSGNYAIVGRATAGTHNFARYTTAWAGVDSSSELYYKVYAWE